MTGPSQTSAPRPSARDHGRFALWAPAASQVSIRVDGTVHEMLSGEGGWF